MSSFQLVGNLIQIDPVVEVSDKFKKREFIVEEENERDPKYNDYHRFQLTQDRCEKIDSAKVGDKIKVQFELKGRKWVKEGKVSYFTTLEAWKIEVDQIGNQQATPQQSSNVTENDEQNLPF